jgi:zinc D-Ala-D-Ala carboxypeptidase
MSLVPKKISAHISYQEATKSRTAIKNGIDNTPDENVLEKMKLVAEKVFEPLREEMCVPIGISSFFRSKALNKKIGGSSTSSHVKGEAIDIDADMFGLITNKNIFDYIKDNLEFDQLIWEYGTDKEPNWVHVSYREGNNRNQILVAYKEKDWKGTYRTKYKYYED